MADRTVATTDTLDTLRTTYNSTAADVGDISSVTGASGVIASATDIVEAITLMNTEVTGIKTGATTFETKITFEGATDDAYETSLAVTDPTQDNTITFPDATGTVVTTAATQTLTNKTLTSPTINAGALTGEFTGTADLTGTVLLGASPLVFEGATADGYETTLTITDPTAARTITMPNATDTLVGKATTDIFTNKSYDLGGSGNVMTGSLAEFNSALQSESFVSLTGSETLTNKTLTAPTITSGVLNTAVSGSAVLDEDNFDSNSATQLATQQSIKAYVDAQITAQDFDFAGDSGGALSIDLDSESMTFTGGTGIDTTGSGNVMTFAIDSTVTTLVGSQTLTNKTLTTPTLTSPVLNTGLSGTAFLDEDTLSSNSATKAASQQSIKAYVDATITAQDLDVTSDSGTIDIDLDSETLTVAGGTGLASVGSGSTITVNIDSTVATLTGSQTLTNKTLTAPTITSGVLNTAVSGSAVLDEDAMGSNSATQVATQQSIKAYVDATITAQDLDVTSDSGTIDIDLDSETLTIAGGTGMTSVGSGSTITVSVDSTVVTLTGTQTLTNKTLTAPTLNSPTITSLTATSLTLSDSSIVFEGATADEYETTLTVVDPTADRTITIPNETGTLITSASAATNAFSIALAAALG